MFHPACALTGAHHIEVQAGTQHTCDMLKKYPVIPDSYMRIVYPLVGRRSRSEESRAPESRAGPASTNEGHKGDLAIRPPQVFDARFPVGDTYSPTPWASP